MTEDIIPEDVAALELLRKPFEPNQISKLPKETGAQIKERRNEVTGRDAMVFNCPVCGGHHHKKAVHLDYVGHAALTDRLLEADLGWNWEPAAWTREGLPQFDAMGGLWIRLTVAGVTRLGYGSADGKEGPDAIKEVIGDALRNAGMRFGAALDLWHKGDLHAKANLDQPGAAPNGKGAPSETGERIAFPAGKSPPTEPRKNSSQARKDGDWEFLTGGMKAQRSAEELMAWAADPKNAALIARQPPKHKEQLREFYAGELERVRKADADRDLDGKFNPQTGELYSDDEDYGAREEDDFPGALHTEGGYARASGR